MGGTNLKYFPTDFCGIPRHVLRLDGVEDEDTLELEAWFRGTHDMVCNL